MLSLQNAGQAGQSKKDSDTEKTVRVKFQWVHYKDEKFQSRKGYKQVYFGDGGGLREFFMPCDVGFDDILTKAKEIYFPGGRSSKGNLHDMQIKLGDHSMQPISKFTNLEGDDCNYKEYLSCRGLYASKCSVFLITRYTSSSKQEDNESEPAAKKITRYTSSSKREDNESEPAAKKTATLTEEDVPKLQLADKAFSPISITYFKQQPSADWDAVSTISVTGRNQVRDWLLMQDHSGEIRMEGEDIDPLKFGFSVKSIRKDRIKYLDVEYPDLRQTMAGIDDIERNQADVLTYVFPAASRCSETSSQIVHGPDEINGWDDDRLIIGVVFKQHSKEAVLYRWFQNQTLIASGNMENIIEIKQAGVYSCEIEVNGAREKSKEIHIIDAKAHQALQAQQEGTVNDLPELSVPTISVTELSFTKSDEIGKGAFARVYKGKWIGTTVAIKFIECKRGQKKIKAMVQEEVKVNTVIRHPNFVHLMAVASDHTGIYLITEFIDGFNMEDYIFDEEVKNAEKLNLTNKLFITVQVLQAICYLHGLEKSIIHRDIKPANILISRKSRTTKLCDLGISKIKTMTSCSLTSLGGQPGTPGYMAPEVLIDGKLATAASDIWSIGISLIEFFAEEEAWGDDVCTYEEIKKEIQKGNQPRALGKITNPIREMLGKCVEFSPDKRCSGIQILSLFQRIA